MSGRALASGRGAVMASRQLPAESLDFFPTPPFATRALIARVLRHLHGGRALPLGRVLDPACGQGHMTEVLSECARTVMASDIFDYGYGTGGCNFLADEPPANAEDWIVCNPPFVPAVDFTLRALERARRGVAMLCRTSWIEGGDRYRRLFADRPPTLFAPFVERVPMVAGRWDPAGKTATAYAWFVWRFDAAGELRAPIVPYWIPPCREELTLETDRARFAAWSLRPDSKPEIRAIAHGLCRADDKDPRRTVSVPAFQTLTYRERKAVASKLLGLRRRVPQWEARRREADDIVARRATIEALVKYRNAA